VETAAAAEILGVERVEFLGYRDSGMADDPRRHDDGSFASADIEEAAGRLAAILEEEHADVLTVYDSNGNYGHPDHIQVQPRRASSGGAGRDTRGVRGDDEP